MPDDPIQRPVADLLPRLRNQLEEEYGGSVPSDTIEQVAEQTLREFQRVKVREFVPVFAWRRARQRLRRIP
jgi:hypothetical protein